MWSSANPSRRVVPRAPTASPLAALFVDGWDQDARAVWIPSPETHLLVRLGSSARQGLDVYALGARYRVHRKLIPRGLSAIVARLRLGVSDAVVGVPASAIVERIVPLEDLWGGAATRQLRDRLAGARDSVDAALLLERAIADRHAVARARERPRHARAQLALAAADRLTRAHVSDVAAALGVSERHLRRAFREAFGASPKAFAKLTRFRRALGAAREEGRASWANIATDAGYYDQAHLIAEFRAIAGVTPRALLGELRAGG